MLKVSLLWFITLLSACVAAPTSKNNSPAELERVAVLRVIDGDTFVVSDGTAKGKTIRLIGIDAPETRKSARRDIGYYGKESKAYLKKMLSDEVVNLSYDAGKMDRYGRTLAYVYLQDGTFVNARMVEEGYAVVMTVPPNVRYADRFLNLERKAKRLRKGLWKK